MEAAITAQGTGSQRSPRHSAAFLLCTIAQSPQPVATLRQLPLMLWLKAFHVVFVVAWFAGLFYLPRLFVYHAAATDAPGLERFIIMERRLFRIMTMGAALAALFRIWMIPAAPAYLAAGQLRVGLVL